MGNPVTKRLRRDAQDAIDRHKGMIVGMPRAQVDANSLIHVCDRHDKMQGRIRELEARAQELEAERDEARRYGERLYAECSGNARNVACVWCGEQFADDVPASQDERLLAHAKVCPKHPLSGEKARADRLEAERDQWQESSGQNYVRATEAEAREERLREAIEPVLRLVEFEMRGNPNRELPPWKEPLDRLRKALETTDDQ